ncbi:MAG: MFS transporter [Burkholderiaceae bacterium]
MTSEPGLRRAWLGLPAGIWALGLVSLLADIASEMVHSLLPVFLLGLGTSVAMIGLIEGVAESTALIVKIFSGVLSDRFGRRKPFAVLGYAMGALSKPLFALASSTGMVFGARMIDRVGKGIRGAPRDALVADLAPPGLRGAAFGLRQALDSVGAFVGPLIAIGLMLAWAGDMRAVFWAAAVPGLLAVALLVVGVREPAVPKVLAPRVNPISRANLRRLGPAYWWVVTIGAAFTLARFSEAFLVLRVQQGGLPIAWVPLVLVAMNVVYSALAYPLGKLADAVRHSTLLMLGLVCLIAGDLLLAWSNHWVFAWSGIVLWGVHFALTQGLLATMVADTAPSDLRGTAFGFFNLVSGVAMLLASVFAGLLWDGVGAGATFVAGAVLAGLALALVALREWRRPRFVAD